MGQPLLKSGSLETSRGIFRLQFSGKGIFEIFFPGSPFPRTCPADVFPWPELGADLERYFCGERPHFTYPLDTSGYTTFTRSVLEVVARIPYGELYSYRKVAQWAGFPRAWRAAGQAVGANRHPLLVPCHRVIRSDGKIGGFSGPMGWKEFLLQLESDRGALR